MRESVDSIICDKGHFEKVSLPGEAVWVRVLEGPHMGIMLGQIDNDACSDLHKYRYGDVVRFGWVVREYDGEAFGAWEPE